MGRNRPRYEPPLTSLAEEIARSPDVETLARQLWAGRTPAELAEAGGELAGGWFAHPEIADPIQLVAAGLLLMGEIDRDQLTPALREGWRRAGSAHGTR